VAEIDDIELKQLREYKEAVVAITKDPSRRMKLLEMWKEADPAKSIPEIDAAQPIRKELSDVRDKTTKELEELRALVEKQRLQQEYKELLTSERAKLRSAGWTSEGIEQVEKLMQERGIGDYEVAAAYIEKSQQAKAAEPSPIEYTGRQWDFTSPDEGDAAHELLMKDPNKFARKEVNKFFAERRGK